MARNIDILIEDVRRLSLGCRVGVPRDLSYVIVRDVKLGPSWNRPTTDVLMETPEDYPVTGPGQRPYGIYLEEGLLRHGRTPEHYHPNGKRPGWVWFCYEGISWDPRRDDLIILLEALRADLEDA